MSVEKTNIHGSDVYINENSDVCVDHVSGSKVTMDSEGNSHIDHVSGLKIIITTDNQMIICDEHENIIHKTSTDSGVNISAEGRIFYSRKL